MLIKLHTYALLAWIGECPHSVQGYHGRALEVYEYGRLVETANRRVGEALVPSVTTFKNKVA